MQINCKDIEKNRIFVLVADDEIIGTGSHTDDHITRVYVLPEYQGRGCGSRLIAEVEHECIEDGMKILAVEVRTDNQRAVKFYKERGFEVINALSDIKMILEKELA